MASRNNDPKQIERRDKQSEVMLAMSRSFSGPLPEPETLRRYNDVLPGAAERIVSMAEKQQDHRQDLEKQVVYENLASQKRGNYLGFAICMTAILGGLWLIYLGKQVTGLIAIITPLTGLVGVFVYGKRKQSTELEEKAKPFKASRRN